MPKRKHPMRRDLRGAKRVKGSPPEVSTTHASFVTTLESLDTSDASAAFFDLAQNDLVSAYQVTIHQDRNTSLHTGGIVWETSYILAAYLIENLKNRPSVIELGAGCGLLGIALAAAKKARPVVVTDQPSAMENLARNVERNPIKNLTAETLTWGDNHGKTYDVICGTDVVFKKTLVKPLLETMWKLAHEESTGYLLIQDREVEAVRRLEKRGSRYFSEAEEIPIELSNRALEKAAHELGCRLFRYRGKVLNL